MPVILTGLKDFYLNNYKIKPEITIIMVVQIFQNCTLQQKHLLTLRLLNLNLKSLKQINLKR